MRMRTNYHAGSGWNWTEDQKMGEDIKDGQWIIGDFPIFPAPVIVQWSVEKKAWIDYKKRIVNREDPKKWADLFF